jgi:hypothetical protein
VKKSCLILGLYSILMGSGSLLAELKCEVFLKAVAENNEQEAFWWAYGYKKAAGLCLSEQGLNAMHIFAQSGNTLSMFSILKHLAQADFSALTPKKETPLMLAAGAKNIKVAQFLLLLRSVRENINHQDNNGQTALHWAVRANSPALVGLLMDENARLSVQDSQGQTPVSLSKELRFGQVAMILGYPLEPERNPPPKRIVIGERRQSFIIDASFSINQ